MTNMYVGDLVLAFFLNRDDRYPQIKVIETEAKFRENKGRFTLVKQGRRVINEQGGEPGHEYREINRFTVRQGKEVIGVQNIRKEIVRKRHR